METAKIIIAIDGHSSCGKSTVAKELSKMLKYRYIDTGAMYRAVTLYALKNNIIENNSINDAVLEAALLSGNLRIDFKFNSKTDNSDCFLNGKPVEKEIRKTEVANNVSQIATLKFVRENLVALQQNMGAGGGVVMDGRDIGTVVFPNAELKIFLTAAAKIRAERRFKELTEKGESVKFEDILENVKLRDKIDSTRKISPLKQAKDAYLIDNSKLSREETLAACIELYNKTINKK